MTKTVLTIDDSRTMRDMLMMALVDAGYRVIQAVDGVDGLETLAAEGADVIITDINMPRMDGFGFIEASNLDLGGISVVAENCPRPLGRFAKHLLFSSYGHVGLLV